MPTTTKSDLLADPLWKAEDLGRPIPNSPHAISVALPLWDHVVGYEEKRPDIMAALACGYPRFLIHPCVQQLFDAATREHAKPGECAFVFPSVRTARRCADFVFEICGTTARTMRWKQTELYAVLVPEKDAPVLKTFWQHFGEILSSRRAEAALEDRPRNHIGVDAARATLTERLATLCGTPTHDVFLYTTGMGAMAAALRLCRARRPKAKTVQLGFPYVDGLKMQNVFGPGVHFFPTCTAKDIDTVLQLADREELAGVFCEIPGNPLLCTPPIKKLSAKLRALGVPLVVDDTVATVANVDVLPLADVAVSSLTKLFSGTGDVMAGSLVLSPHSDLHDELVSLRDPADEATLWDDDVIALEANSRDFLSRARKVNENTFALCSFLREQPGVATIHYPAFTTRTAYEEVRREGGGYGCLFSMELNDAERTAEPFYNALRVCKGPSLGTNYTLASPYTLLAHFDELPWAESHGISRHLIRVSVGLEDANDLIARFDAALRDAMRR